MNEPKLITEDEYFAGLVFLNTASEKLEGKWLDPAYKGQVKTFMRIASGTLAYEIENDLLPL